MKNMRNKSRSGFTLVEMLIAGGIMSILLLILMRVFLQTLETRLAAEAESAVTQDIRYIFSRLAYDIVRADSLTLPINPGESGDAMTLNIGADSYAYALDQGNLVLTNLAGSGQLNSSTVIIESASFTRLGEVDGIDSVVINIDVASVTQRDSGPLRRNITTTIGLR